MADVKIFLLIFFGLVCTVNCQSVSFDSGEAFTAIDQSTLPDASEFVDPKDTGSYLFQSDVDLDQKALSLSILIEHFRSENSYYFRTHPSFITCLQATLSSLRKQEIRADIVSGFKTYSDISGSTKIQHLYARSGVGAVLKFKPGVLGDVKEIARTAIKSCAKLFMTLQRDIGVVLMVDSVHIHMTGASDTTPHFSVDGYTGGMDDAAFHSFAMDILGSSQDPSVLPLDCSSFTMVTNGNRFPSWTTEADDAVGGPDVPVLRTNTDDFSKLTQYVGTHVTFENHERDASWCGYDGQPCFDCRDGIVGSALEKRCTARVMSYRMANVINMLQMFVRYNMSVTDTLKIVKAWDEPYEGNPDGDTSYSRLHTEGRAVVVQLVAANTEGNLEELSQFAICAGADYVAHNGDRLEIAVKKMKGTTELSTSFPRASLIAVDAPMAMSDAYDFPSSFPEEDKVNYPLFYGKGRSDMELADGATLGQFMSSDDTYQYFRLHPSIPNCYSKLLSSLNTTYFGEGDISLEVIRGYIANPEQVSLFSQTTDNRYDTHTLGVAMQIRSAQLLPWKLVEEVIKTCGPIFNEVNETMGLGLYQNSVFVDMRDLFEVWLESESLIPYGSMSKNDYEDYLETIYIAAIEGRIVNPSDPEEACNLAVIPLKQSPTYRYQLPEIVQRRRRRSTPTDVCIPDANTAFCSSTTEEREREVEDVWTEIKRKHIYHEPWEEVYDAIKGCLLDCGTCQEGEIYQEKHRHCSNLVHWMPYSFMNEDADVTNFFPRDKLWGKEFACYSRGHHCLHKAPAFAKLAPNAYRTFRPDPNKSPQEELYSKEENPSPLISILEETYAINAKGVVTFWVEDEKDMLAMEVPFRTVMMYNHNVTNVVIYVRNAYSVNPVGETVEGFIHDMATTGCTLYTRAVLSTYSIGTVPPNHVQKRDLAKANYNFHKAEENTNKFRFPDGRFGVIEAP